MSQKNFVSTDILRSHFAAAMSDMYRREVPAYGELLDIVRDINGEQAEPRMAVERHGAIRLGLPSELSLLRRVFAQMGMFPVGYYDLSVAGLPVHSTAFRPITPDALSHNPFRLFTSLLRLDMIEDADLRDTAETILKARQIASETLLSLLDKAEREQGVSQEDMDVFLRETLSIFRWHGRALVDSETYEALKSAHPLIADIVSFTGPHINHLTPRVTDIDAAHAEISVRGLKAKETIEGPPKRDCPILLRQTAFQALTESVMFTDGINGAHRARFGEIEQRGVALTPKGRALYDRCLEAFKSDPSAFEAFPDDWEGMRDKGLAYFNGNDPITYEDFLPVSAAGIFRSNLGEGSDQLTQKGRANYDGFVRDLGVDTYDPFDLYAAQAV